MIEYTRCSYTKRLSCFAFSRKWTQLSFRRRANLGCVCPAPSSARRKALPCWGSSPRSPPRTWRPRRATGARWRPSGWTSPAREPWEPVAPVLTPGLILLSPYTSGGVGSGGYWILVYWETALFLAAKYMYMFRSKNIFVNQENARSWECRQGLQNITLHLSDHKNSAQCRHESL